jgi:para-aminobenzoate synthetase / 4-amino-4-deoxychorismate lyase
MTIPAVSLDGPLPDPARGVFETTLVAGGRPVALEAHLARLAASLEKLYGLGVPDDARGQVAQAAQGLELGRLRLDVGPDGAASVRVADVDPAAVFPTAPVEVAVVAVPGGIGAHKWADRRLLDRASEEVAPAVPLVLDEDGSVLEGSRSNVFAALDGKVVTPPTDGRILPGVARARAIELARAAGIEVVERPLGLDELATADEVFMTGGVRGVEPVGRCVGVGAWDSGEFTARVGSELQSAWLAADSSS